MLSCCHYKQGIQAGSCFEHLSQQVGGYVTVSLALFPGSYGLRRTSRLEALLLSALRLLTLSMTLGVGLFGCMRGGSGLDLETFGQRNCGAVIERLEN